MAEGNKSHRGRAGVTSSEMCHRINNLDMDSYSGKKNRSSSLSCSTAQQTLHVYEWTSGMEIMRSQLQAGLLRTLA